MKLLKKIVYVSLCLTALFLTSCDTEADGGNPEKHDADSTEGEVPEADGGNTEVKKPYYITDITDNYEDITETFELSGSVFELNFPVSNLVALRFLYPYADPWGKEVMHSGVICIPKGLYISSDKKAQGIMLYNHYTIMTDYECPSYGVVDGKGALGLKEIAGLELSLKQNDDTLALGLSDNRIITVAADYYGFGETDYAQQYYCEANYNAHLSLEALKAAKELLAGLGYSWDDYLVNCGYSQGAQTAIGVLKLVDSGEYDETVSVTFAGSGPYDLTTTYKSYLEAQSDTLDLSVVVQPVLSFNTYHKLGFDYSQLFSQTLYDNLDEWFYSMKHTREEIDQMMKDAGILSLNDTFTEPLHNLDSDESKKLVAALDTVSLISGWEPKTTDRIYLYHSEADRLVQYANCEKMLEFFEEKGFTTKTVETGPYDIIYAILCVQYPDLWTNRPQPGEIVHRKTSDLSHEDGGSWWLLEMISEIKTQIGDIPSDD